MGKVIRQFVFVDFDDDTCYVFDEDELKAHLISICDSNDMEDIDALRDCIEDGELRLFEIKKEIPLEVETQAQIIAKF